MNFDYDHRLALLDLSGISHISLAATFLDTVFWSKYHKYTWFSSTIYLSPFLFRFLIRRDFWKYGSSVISFYSSHFEVDLSLRGFSYRIEMSKEIQMMSGFSSSVSTGRLSMMASSTSPVPIP